MKVYVDSVPFCDNCPCRDEYFCKLIEKDVFDEFYSIDDENGIHKECPIKHISDHTKQVRKEVLGELVNMLGDRAELIQTAENESTFMFDTYDLTMCVEEILGEEVKQNEK